MTEKPLAVIVGVGDGLSASLARLLAKEGYALALAARSVEKLAALAKETGASTHACDASKPDDVSKLFASLPTVPSVVTYNASFRVRGPLIELDPADVLKTLEVTSFGAFLVTRAAAKAMLPQGSGTILLTGASAGVKGYARSAPFAMGKFGLRGLAQAAARELHPQGIHVVHAVIDGGIRSARRLDEPGKDTLLDPDAIAESYLHVIRQPRSAWSAEIELRPWVETF